MASHFHQLQVKAITKETADCVSVSFTVPDNLQEIFTYKEGQNITLKKVINGDEVRRSYSICNAPYEQELKVAIKKTTGGLFSSFANDELTVGEMLDVLPPTGKFTAKNNEGKFLAIAAGSGITPIIAIIKHTLKTQPNSSFTLIYSNKSRASIIFFEEIEALKNKYIQRFNCINILSRERTDADINFGRIDAQKLENLGNQLDFKNFTDAYICGPEEMIFTAAQFLENEGMPKQTIHFELFTSTNSNKKFIAVADVDDTQPKSNITIKVDGREFNFNLAYKSNNILDAALAQGADLPYACKGGVCCTCRAKLVQGQVSMDVNYALEADEVANGFILTCQSHPVTDVVVVDFDVK